MTRAEQYRARAKQAEAEAERASNDIVKEAFLKIAREYRNLAEQIEQQR
jgi:hypothetical protein